MQLVAYGAQDIYLTGNPQITFFKVVYRRHTNFATESIEQVFNGTAGFGKKVIATVSRNGDLIGPTYLQVTLPSLTLSTPANNWVGWTNSIGHALIDYVEVEIGGQKIDKHYGEWLEIWAELTQTAEHWDGFNEMVGRLAAPMSMWTNAVTDNTYYVPLQFWFNRNPGLALPLIALQYHEVKINIQFRPLNQLIRSGSTSITPVNGSGSGTPEITSAALWIDYTYLDTDERRRFAQVSHEYLIEQLQFTGQETVSAGSNSPKPRLNFNHPVKELVWVIRRDAVATAGDYLDGNQWFNFLGTNASGEEVDMLSYAKLLLNGHDRFATRAAKYFRLVQPYQCHTRISRGGIYVYSFGLKPEEHQPSGTCNFSRIDNAQLQLTLDSTINASDNKSIFIFATNYNVLRIMSGMGGLAYSN